MTNKTPTILNENDDGDDDDYDYSFTEVGSGSSEAEEDDDVTNKTDDDDDVETDDDDEIYDNDDAVSIRENKDYGDGLSLREVSRSRTSQKSDDTPIKASSVEAGNNDIIIYDDASEVDDEINDVTSEDGNELLEPEILIVKKEKLALKYKHKKMFDAAIKEYIKCLALASIIYEGNDWKLFNYRVLLAFAYQELKGLSVQALHHCQLCQTFLDNAQYEIEEKVMKSEEFNKFLFNLYYTMGLAQTATKKFKEAEESLLRAKNILTNAAKARHSLNNCEFNLILALARLYHKNNKSELSLKYYDKAAEMEITRNGKNSIKLISIYQSLGKVEQNKRSSINHEKAIEYFLKAHSIANHNFNIKSLQVADTAYHVGLAYANVNDNDADISAEEYFKEALGSYRSTLGSNSKKTLETLDELSRLYIRTERIGEAISLLEKSLKLKEEAYGYYSPQVARTYKLIGSSYMSLGKIQNSWKAFEKCHNIECTIYGKNSKRSADTKLTLDVLMQNPLVSSKMKNTFGSNQNIPSSRISSARISRKVN